MKKILFLFIFLLLSRLGFAQELSGLEIMQSVYGRDDGRDTYTKTRMLLVDKNRHTRERLVEMYTKDYGDLMKGYIEFLEPADIKGTAFLSWEHEGKDDTQYLYLPALGRARRIVSSQKDLRFVNTDFTYEDMQRRLPSKDTHQRLPDASFNGLDCYQVQSVAREGTSQYKKRLHWVDKKSLLIVKTLFYNKKDEMIKEFQVKALDKVDGYWTALATTMTDHKDKHETQLHALTVKYDQGLDDGLFTTRQFQSQR